MLKIPQVFFQTGEALVGGGGTPAPVLPPPSKERPVSQAVPSVTIDILDLLEGDIITVRSIDSTSPQRFAIGPFNEPILVRRLWFQDTTTGVSDSYLLAWSKNDNTAQSILVNGQILWYAPQFGKSDAAGNPLTAPAILIQSAQGVFQFEINRPVTAAPFFLKFEWTQFGALSGREYFMAMEIKYLQRPIKDLIDFVRSISPPPPPPPPPVVTPPPPPPPPPPVVTPPPPPPPPPPVVTPPPPPPPPPVITPPPPIIIAYADDVAAKMWLDVDSLMTQIINLQSKDPGLIPPLRTQGLNLLAQIKQLIDANLLSKINSQNILDNYNSVYHFFQVLATL